MTRHTTTHCLLEGLAALGAGHVSINEEITRWQAAGRNHPEVFLCPHEHLTIPMAGAYAAATGRGQALRVPVDAGAANVANIKAAP